MARTTWARPPGTALPRRPPLPPPAATSSAIPPGAAAAPSPTASTGPTRRRSALPGPRPPATSSSAATCSRPSSGRPEPSLSVVSSLSGATETVEADFTSVDNNLGPKFGLVLRYQDPQNYYLIHRVTGGSSLLYISKVVNGVQTDLAIRLDREPHQGRGLPPHGTGHGNDPLARFRRGQQDQRQRHDLRDRQGRDPWSSTTNVAFSSRPTTSRRRCSRAGSKV